MSHTDGMQVHRWPSGALLLALLLGCLLGCVAGCERTCPAITPSPFVQKLRVLPAAAVLCAERGDGLRAQLPKTTMDDAEAAFMIHLPKVGWGLAPSSYPHQVRAQFGLGANACKAVVSFSEKPGAATFADVVFDNCR